MDGSGFASKPHAEALGLKLGLGQQPTYTVRLSNRATLLGGRWRPAPVSILPRRVARANFSPHTFDSLDFASTETSKRSLVLGSRDARRPHSSLDIDQGSSNGGATLPGSKTLLGSHV